jgi:hypothetical protein
MRSAGKRVRTVQAIGPDGTEGIKKKKKKKKVPEGTLFQEATAPNWALSCGQQVQKYLHGG